MLLKQSASAAQVHAPVRQLSHFESLPLTRRPYRRIPVGSTGLDDSRDLIQTMTMWVLLYLLIAACLAAGYLFWARVAGLWPFPLF